MTGRASDTGAWAAAGEELAIRGLLDRNRFSVVGSGSVIAGKLLQGVSSFAVRELRSTRTGMRC